MFCVLLCFFVVLLNQVSPPLSCPLEFLWPKAEAQRPSWGAFAPCSGAPLGALNVSFYGYPLKWATN